MSIDPFTGADATASTGPGAPPAASPDAAGHPTADASVLLEVLSGTALGRAAWRWSHFTREHPAVSRLLMRPWRVAVEFATLQRPWWLRPHPLFDRTFYLGANPDVRGGLLPAWWHYVRHGAQEGRQPNRWMDPLWYGRAYPDVEAGRLVAIDHYHRFGWREGRDPGPSFDTRAYLRRHPDVAAAGVDPLVHAIRGDAARSVGRRRAGVPMAPMTTAGVPDAGAAESATAGAQDAGAVTSPATLTHATDPRAVRRLLGSAPPGAYVGVLAAGLGDASALETPGRTVRRIGRDGTLGDLPHTQLGAIAYVEVLRSEGIDALVVPAAAPWAAALPGLLPALRGRYAVRAATPAGVLLDLRAPVVPGDERWATSLAAVVDAVAARLGRRPSLLTWGTTEELPAALTDGGLLRAIDPMGWGLPHADHSVDLVALPAAAAATEALAEARRVAIHAVVQLAPEPGTDGRVAVSAVERLEAPDASARPSVSVVIPTYEDESMIATCLRSLWETVPAGIELEVIVSDDGSRAPVAERVAALVAQHPGTRLVANPVNGGYISAVSAGVAAARNDILITLNNDTLLLPGWVEGLLDTFAAHPDAGVVGGRLLYPDGRLQEAGCAIFRDGSATKVGYGDDNPERAFYQHLRPVDYVSGALLATPRTLYEELGGLDRDYGFGYYEDGDYCFRVRAAGRTVLYQPAATIVHVEGGTAGLDVSTGPKASQVRNQRLFVERWAATLAHHPVRPVPLDLAASRLLAASPGPWMEPTAREVAA